MKNRLLFIFFLLFSYITPSAFGDPSNAKKKILFIVNPISHEIQGLNVRKIIEKKLDLDQFEYKIVYTQYAQHATKLAQDALESADIIAAVGGDGTVNEVGRALINTKATLAIIPVGSGNGLARHFGVPVGIAPAIKALNSAHPIVIDTGTINGKPFLGVAGVGFDALVAHEFAQFGKRGFWSYCQVVFREYPNYEPSNYLITLDGKQILRNAFILTFANSSQYGNNFTIAPKAKAGDGYLDLIVIDDVPWYAAPKLIYRFKHGNLNRSRHCETYRFKELTVQCPSLQAHIDGEPILLKQNLKVAIKPNSLKLMVPRAKR